MEVVLFFLLVLEVSWFFFFKVVIKVVLFLGKRTWDSRFDGRIFREFVEEF